MNCFLNNSADEHENFNFTLVLWRGYSFITFLETWKYIWMSQFWFSNICWSRGVSVAHSHTYNWVFGLHTKKLHLFINYFQWYLCNNDRKIYYSVFAAFANASSWRISIWEAIKESCPAYSRTWGYWRCQRCSIWCSWWTCTSPVGTGWKRTETGRTGRKNCSYALQCWFFLKTCSWGEYIKLNIKLIVK